MKRLNFFSVVISILPLLFFILHSCGFKQSKEEIIVGEWSAHWETVPDESLPGISGENLKMKGAIHFRESGKVDISAYGFQGCIFSDDTMINTLNWELADSILRFIDEGDEFGLPYKINKFGKNEIHLVLLEDINLTLSRN
jgi:hypothetical protein